MNINFFRISLPGSSAGKMVGGTTKKEIRIIKSWITQYYAADLDALKDKPKIPEQMIGEKAS